MLVLERGDLVFVFNFHPVNSFSEYRVGAYLPGPYKARPRPALGLCARVQKPKLTLASARPRAHARKGGGRGPALSRPAPRPDRRAARPEPVAGQATQPECAFALYMARGVQARAPSRSGARAAGGAVLGRGGVWRLAQREQGARCGVRHRVRRPRRPPALVHRVCALAHRGRLRARAVLRRQGARPLQALSLP